MLSYVEISTCAGIVKTGNYSVKVKNTRYFYYISRKDYFILVKRKHFNKWSFLYCSKTGLPGLIMRRISTSNINGQELHILE